MKKFTTWLENMNAQPGNWDWQTHLRTAIDALGQAASAAAISKPDIGQKLDSILDQLFTLSQQVNPVDASKLQPGDRRY